MITKTELKELWERSGFRPTKRLGQNFLIDKNVKDKILRHLELGREDTVIEIGPGFGEITFGLAERAKNVIAVEKDKKIAEILKSQFELPDNVRLIEKDFLDINLPEIARRQKVIVYGNIPYYATSPIIEKLIDNISVIKDIYLVLQKEVAIRILAQPGSKDIGRLTVYVQYYTEPELVFKIGKGCFYPSPDVESVLIRLTVPAKRKIRVKDEKAFFEIVKRAYGQRRKTILNSLSPLGMTKTELARLLESAGISPDSRPETLSIQDFANLADLLVVAKP